jgi:hypothetical protein
MTTLYTYLLGNRTGQNPFLGLYTVEILYVWLITSCQTPNKKTELLPSKLEQIVARKKCSSWGLDNREQGERHPFAARRQAVSYAKCI